MARVQSNNVALQFSVEASLGTLAGTPVWFVLEPNDIGRLNAQITTVSRNFINKSRRKKKGATVGLESGVEFTADLTMDMAYHMYKRFMFAKPTGLGLAGGEPFRPTAVNSTEYVVASGGALAEGLLIYASGFAVDGNNGLKVVGASSTGTAIKASGLAAETTTGPQNATVRVAGVQGTTGDIEVDASGDLVATTLDFTTLGLRVGQWIWVGGTDTAHRFANAANRGWARIRAIAAGKLTLDKSSFVTDNGSGKTIRLFFGSFIRDVDVDHADFLQESLQFEAEYQDLGGVGVSHFAYAKGNFCNEMQEQFPLEGKAEVSFAFVGTDTAPPSASRADEGANGRRVVLDKLFNTSADISRLELTEVNESEVSVDFSSLTLTMNNNVSPEKKLGVLGGAVMNFGDIDVMFEASLWFGSSAVPDAIRNNRALSFVSALRNEDGAIVRDIPYLTLSGGDLDMPENETVKIQTTGTAHEDPSLGFCTSVSLFPYVPES